MDAVDRFKMAVPFIGAAAVVLLLLTAAMCRSGCQVQPAYAPVRPVRYVPGYKPVEYDDEYFFYEEDDDYFDRDFDDEWEFDD